MPQQPSRDREEVYSPTARRFHWLTVALIAVQVPLGLAMYYRGNQLNIWDGTTNFMYSLHKLLGFTLLLVIVARAFYRLIHGAPEDAKNLETWQKIGSHVVHFFLYLLLFAVPILGWVGVQRFGAVDIFGLFSLPTFLPQNPAKADRAFFLHKLGAFVLLALIAVHIAAALYHHYIRHDGVLRRMWPGREA
jgi:cytochrome b561